MHVEVNLDEAVTAGIINEHQALALRNFEAAKAGIPSASAEKFQIFGGLNDLMAAMGMAVLAASIMLLLGGNGGAAGGLGIILLLILPPLLFFCAKKLVSRAAPMTSMAIMLAYMAFSVWPITMLVRESASHSFRDEAWGISAMLSSLISGFIFWRRFSFPPLPAAAAGIFSIGLMAIFLPSYPEPSNYVIANIVLLFSATVIFGAACWLDITDIRRETERSQIAFWLHCCTGILLSRSLFSLITGENALQTAFELTTSHLYVFALIFFIFSTLSLIIDRRSLLISMALPSLSIIHSTDNWLLGYPIIGCVLLLFSLGWVRARRILVDHLPKRIAAQLPRTDITQYGQRPTRRNFPLSRRSTEKTSEAVKNLIGFTRR